MHLFSLKKLFFFTTKTLIISRKNVTKLTNEKVSFPNTKVTQIVLLDTHIHTHTSRKQTKNVTDSWNDKIITFTSQQ